MSRLSYDLHIHSCLSPCGSDDNTPSNIVGMAAVAGLDVIAITDHNSCKNCPAAVKIAEELKRLGEADLIVIPGMELTTAEEVHVLCLFDDLQNAMAFDEYVCSVLPPFPNNEEIFGKQQVMNEDDEVTATIPNLLINATTLGFSDVYDVVEKYRGVMIPAHIDKSSTSLLSSLGFIPPDSKFTCAEVKHTGFLDKLLEQHPYLKNCRIIVDSDAHYLEDINEPVNFIEIAAKNKNEVTAKDILKALTERN